MSNQVTTADARREFGDIVNRVAFGNERVTVTRHGKEVVTIISVEDAALLSELEDRYDLEIARKALREKGSISLDEMIERHG